MTIITALARRLSGPASVVPQVVDDAPVPMTARRPSVFSVATASAGSPAQQMSAMGQVGVLFAIVDKLATGVASVEWHLYRRAKSGLKEDRTEVMSHPALVVLNRPNPFTTRQELFETSQQHQDLTGECWWILARNPRAKMPIEIWPVRPDRMRPKTHPTKFITGYEYVAPDGAKVGLDIDEVLFVRRPNPLDPWRGIGPVQSVLNYIDGEHYSAQWNRQFYLNGAVPGGIIEVEKRLSDPEFDEMAARWKEQHQGVSNAHRVAILEQATWRDVKYSHEDAQFSELSRLSDEKVRQAFGFPKPMLGSVDDVNRANAEAAYYVYSEWCLKPRLERFKAALNSEFLPLFPGSEGLEFDFDSPTQEDSSLANASRDSRVLAVVRLLRAGFAPAEVLEWADMPALPHSEPVMPAGVSDSPPPDEDDDEDMADSDPATLRAVAARRLGGFLLDAPSARERARRIEMLRVLAAPDSDTDSRAEVLPW